MSKDKKATTSNASVSGMAWGIFSVCAIAMGFGTLLLEFFRENHEVNVLQLPAIIAVALGLLSLVLIGLRSAISENEARSRLRRTAIQLGALADNVPGALFQWYMRGDEQKFVYCSQRSLDIFGFSAEALVQDWHTLPVHPGDLTRWAESLRQSRDTLQNWFFEGRFVLPGDEIKWWRGIAKPSLEEDGSVMFNGIMIDITDVKEAEREIKETRRNAERLGAEILMVNQSLNETNGTLNRINRQKNEILGIAAHDLKNPLGGVVGFAGAIRVNLDQENLTPFRREMIEMTDAIEQSARHMLQIINGLLNASALEDGSVELFIDPCDMEGLVGSAMSMNEAMARGKNISLRMEAEPGCSVDCDAQRILEVVDNLLSNAIKYSMPGRSVWLRVFRSSPTSVQISVRDEGPGLTEDDKKKLFGKFQKLSARPTAGETSTGLGLAIAKSIVDLHHGRIWAESEYGKGAVFNVDLPVEYREGKKK